MANRHFAKLADVWKHLPLAEICSIERPDEYWESHAGSARYALVDDPERRFGAARFSDLADSRPALAGSRYVAHLRATNPAPGGLAVYPGSPLLAMLELGAEASYLLCDIDPGSVADLTETSARLGLASRTRVVAGDGIGAVHDEIAATTRPGAVLAHVDPYEPRQPGPSGLSAVDLARELVDGGAGLVYWYGYGRPERRAWALAELSAGAGDRSLWCGDILVTSVAEPHTRDDGDLGEATTPGTGFGIVCANISDPAVAACRQLGEALVAAYEGVPLPDGSPGRLDFTARE
jgi:23S rRNA A2030 N6-methylase RlmJ